MKPSQAGETPEGTSCAACEAEALQIIDTLDPEEPQEDNMTGPAAIHEGTKTAEI